MREHTERIAPPRALWVPFPLGRPFGAPDEPGFQQRVLRATLDLINRESGPVLEDFPDDAPGQSAGDEAWACPLPLPSPPEPATDAEAFAQQLLAEVGRMKPWHEQALRKHGRTAFGLTGLGPERVDEVAALVAAAAYDVIGQKPEGANVDVPLLVRFAADDMRAFYTEAAAAQPAAKRPTPDEIARWLYGDTVLGDAFYRTRDALTAHEDDRALQGVGRSMVPGAYRERPAKA